MSYFFDNLPVTLTTNKKNKTVITVLGDFAADNLTKDKHELSDLSARMITVEGDNTANKADISVLKSKVSEHSTQLSGLVADNTANKADISVIKTQLSTHSTQLSGLVADNTVNKADISVIKTQLSTQSTQLSGLVADNTANKANIATLTATGVEQGTRIGILEKEINRRNRTVLIDAASPYVTAQDEYIYVTDTSCTFATIRIPENQDTLFGFSFRVVDFGSGGFQIVQSDNQQIVSQGTSSTKGSEGGLKSLSKFGAVSLILVKKGTVDVFVIDGELPSNMILF